MERALITGMTGFVGSHLAELLLDNGIEVWGTHFGQSMDNISHIKDSVNVVDTDMRSYSSVENAVKKSRPDYVFHLAAQSYPPLAWKKPAETIKINVIGSIYLFDAISKSGFSPAIQIAGSSEEYGMFSPNDLPLKEQTPLRPLNPYAVSKVAQEMLSIIYSKSRGMRTIITRAFNHTGPRRPDLFVISSFAKQVVEAEKGKRAVILVGNLGAERDFLDVRDVVRAYWLAVNKCKSGEPYNICSGKSRSVKSVLDMLISMSSAKNIEVKTDPGRMRPIDIPVIRGDCTKFMKATGWKPEIPFEKTLKDILEWWRERI